MLSKSPHPAGLVFSPPLLTASLIRPVRKRHPSLPQRPKSPVRKKPSAAKAATFAILSSRLPAYNARGTDADLAFGLEESDISNDSNFWTEGGDSVTAMRLITAARERNIALDTETIFNHLVLMDMANSCRPTEPDKDSEVDPRPEELDRNVVQACAEACGVQQDLIEDIFFAANF
ncbi:hypothetical protein HO133_001471 [Letharia lupina]|uniref:Carrier domain-containing protein n=1 Tax=Letharia lupina TaxID=560253 RepID=A0A8H6CFF3_9LECA|nr:uncharacterized protein HO133_001471 [Letharia lupina]KAF6222385.1 hypothetical protein HO133_001471 [Letharia lupina]